MCPEPTDNSEAAPCSQCEDVARAAARTMPWFMGTLAAGFREQGEGLHPAQLKLLMAIRHAPLSPSQLAETMSVSMPTISKSLAVLEQRGLVDRVADESDRRRVRLVMTDEGRAIMRRVNDAGIERLAQMLSSATSEELDSIGEGMESLSDVLRRAHPERANRCLGHVPDEGAPTT